MRISPRLRGFRFELIFGLGLKAGGAVASFALTWLIARAYGAATLGLFQVGLATIYLVAHLAVLGLDNVLIRAVSIDLKDGQHARARANYLHARKQIVLLAIGLAVAQALLAYPFAHYVLGEPQAAPYLIAIAPGLIFLVTTRMASALLRSAGQIFYSQSLDGIFYASIASVIVAVAWITGHNGQPIIVPLAFVFGLLLSAIASWMLVGRQTRHWGDQGKPNLARLAGLTIAAVYTINQGIDWSLLMLVTGMLGPADAGIYRGTVQVGTVFVMINTTFIAMAGPHLAAAGAAGDQARINSIIRTAGLTGLVLSAPLALVVFIAPGWLLGLLGPEFRAGASTLVLLAIAQLINVGFGPLGAALMMQHRERQLLLIEVGAFFLVVGSAAVATFWWGLIGAGIALIVGAVFRNALYYLAIGRRRSGGLAESAA